MNTTNTRTEAPKPTADRPQDGLYWARRSTRWDVYPQQEPLQLVAFDYDGFWEPFPDGTWFKTPTSYALAERADGLTGGRWASCYVTARVSTRHYLREDQIESFITDHGFGYSLDHAANRADFVRQAHAEACHDCEGHKAAS